MNAIKNETQLWYCNVCDKTINFSSKSKHNSFKTHKHKEKSGTIVKGYEFIRPEIDEVNYLFNDTIEDCRTKYFHSFEKRCVYVIEFTNMGKNEEIIITNNNWYIKFKWIK